jgi:hypothetical protein
VIGDKKYMRSPKFLCDILYPFQNRDKKGNLMFRVSAILMTTLLIFSMMPVSFAQQQSIEAQAKADAHRDVNRDMKESLWFTAGLVGSSVGTVTGCVSGILAGYLIGDFLPDGVPAVESCSIGGILLFGILAAPICVHLYPHSPRPPPERFLGKTPEYVAAYTQAYRSKAISLRKRWVTAGSITSNLGILTLLLNW